MVYLVRFFHRLMKIDIFEFYHPSYVLCERTCPPAHLLQPHLCAPLNSSAVEQDVVFGCHGDAMGRMTVQIAAMKMAVRKPVRLFVMSFSV